MDERTLLAYIIGKYPNIRIPISWYDISLHSNLSEDFIREFQDKVLWDCISSHQELSEDFIREFQDKVDWAAICRSKKLSRDFVREFQDKLQDYIFFD